MNAIKWLLAVVACLVGAEAALAMGTATNVKGTVTAQSPSGVGRTIRQGDIVLSGETVVTGAGSTAVVSFPDGEVVALAPETQARIVKYAYDPRTKRGEFEMRVIKGGVRAVTGEMAKTNPDSVVYFGGANRINVRGTDVTIVVDGTGRAVVTVTQGMIAMQIGSQTVMVPAGQGVDARADGTFQQAAIAQILAALLGTPEGAALVASLGSVEALAAVVAAAVSSAASGAQSSVTVPTSGPSIVVVQPRPSNS